MCFTGRWDTERPPQNIDYETKAVIDNFLDLIIRDFRARKAYAG